MRKNMKISLESIYHRGVKIEKEILVVSSQEKFLFLDLCALVEGKKLIRFSAVNFSSFFFLSSPFRFRINMK